MRRFGPILLLVSGALTVAAAPPEPFLDHVRVLAGDVAEGRSPGTPGDELVIAYIEATFQDIGLDAPFEVKVVSDEGKLSLEQHYRQPFSYMRRPYILSEHAALHAGAGERVLGDDEFNTLGLSGSGRLDRAPIVFVGYSIVIGEDLYGSYDDGPHDLHGKVALVLSYEPMTMFGASRWVKESWSYHSAVPPKIGAALRRGAAGVILVNPPGALDPNVDSLLEVKQTGGVSYPAPVIHADHAAIDRMLQFAGQRSLASLRREADKGTAIIDLENVAVTLYTKVEAGPAHTANVAGLLPGHGDLARELVVVTAHHDHVGRGGLGSRADDQRRDQIHPGADDNASGAAALLVLADRIKARYDALPDDAEARSVLFLSLGAGEYSLRGAHHYLRRPIKPATSNAVVVNIDSIGRIGHGGLTLAGAGSGQGLREHLEAVAAGAALPITIIDGLGMTSDHHVFYATRRPVILVTETTRNPDHHTPADSIENLDPDHATEAIDLIFELVLKMSQIDRPKFTEAPEPDDDESL